MDEIIRLASSRLSESVSRDLRSSYNRSRIWLSPRHRTWTREDNSITHHADKLALYDKRTYDLEIFSHDANLCAAFCMIILQDAVCFGYELPAICSTCSKLPQQDLRPNDLPGMSSEERQGRQLLRA